MLLINYNSHVSRFHRSEVDRIDHCQTTVSLFNIWRLDAGNHKRLRSNSLYVFYSWQDLKDFIRKETKIETAFCQAHRDKVGEGVGKYKNMWLKIKSRL